MRFEGFPGCHGNDDLSYIGDIIMNIKKEVQWRLISYIDLGDILGLNLKEFMVSSWPKWGNDVRHGR